ncbi:MAG: HD domain-containing protein [Verrucomicrobiota bacterium]
MSSLTIAALKGQAGEIPLLAVVIAQLQSRAAKETKTGKPYLELSFADSTGSFLLKIWSDSPVFAFAADLPDAEIVRLEAKWLQNSYGIDARELAFHRPDDAALEDFFAGDPLLKARQEKDFAEIVRLVGTIGDPRLLALCERFLDQMGARFRRTAAARRNHHARRGGLVEHVASMMRSADALCVVYPDLNRDLLLTGVLFHDCGKLWENSYAEHGFSQSSTFAGEMLGHIPLGIECVNFHWREIMDSEAAAAWATLQPPAETTRLHLLHLVGSHHGEFQFGSPVLPRTPEAFALHHIDNLDAKLEMVREAYATANQSSPGIYERVFPLPANLVAPLPLLTDPS